MLKSKDWDKRHIVSNISQAVINFKYDSGYGLGIDEKIRKEIDKVSKKILKYIWKIEDEKTKRITFID